MSVTQTENVFCWFIRRIHVLKIFALLTQIKKYRERCQFIADEQIQKKTHTKMEKT